MKISNGVRRIQIWFLVVILGSLYFFTLAPDVYLEDSGELVAASYFMGIAHPSGYPLYLLLGKLFSYLPFGTVAFRLNLMSAVFGVATAVTLFLVLCELGRILETRVTSPYPSPKASTLFPSLLVSLREIFTTGEGGPPAGGADEGYPPRADTTSPAPRLRSGHPPHAWGGNQGRAVAEREKGRGYGRVSEWIAFALALIFAIGRDFWSQAIVAEVYSLNTFLAGLLMYFFFRWWSEPKDTYLFILAFLSGLGLTNHLLFGLMLPIIWTIIFWWSYYNGKGESLSGNPKKIFKLIGLFLLGFSVYLYLPIRAHEHPEINFNQVSTVLDSLNHLLRSYYQDTGFGVGQKWGFVVGFSRSLVLNLTAFFGLAAAGALFILIRKRQIELFVLLVSSFLISVLVPIFFRNVPYSPEAEYTYRVYHFQAYFFVVLLAFIFLNFLEKGRKLFVAGLFMLAAALAFGNFSSVNLRGNPVASYYEQKLESFPPQATYLLVSEGHDNDSEIFTLLYLQKVKGIRRDIRIIDTARIFYIPSAPLERKDLEKLKVRRERYLKHVIEQFGSTHTLFTSFPVERYTSDFRSLPTGYAYETLKKEERDSAIQNLDLASSGPFLPRQEWDRAYQDFLAANFYSLAASALYKNDPLTAFDFLQKAAKFDNELGSEDYQALRIFESGLTNGKN